MFRLKFPSGAVLEMGIGKTISETEYQGTLYIWPDDLDALLEIAEQEKDKLNDNPVPRTEKHNRNKSHNG